MKYIKIYEDLKTYNGKFWVVKNDDNLHISLFKIYLLIKNGYDLESLISIFTFIAGGINLFKNDDNKFRKNFYIALKFPTLRTNQSSISYSKYDYSPDTCAYSHKGFKYMGHLEINNDDIEKYDKYKDEYDMYKNAKNFNL